MARLYDRRDLDFVLNDVLNVAQLTRFPRYKEHSSEVFEMILDAADKLAHEVIAPTNIDGDRIGVKYDNGKVIVPDSFGKALEAVRDGSWITLMDDEKVGGQQIPFVVGVNTSSGMFASANFSFMMLVGMMHGAGKLVEEYGTDRQKKLFMDPMYAGKWGGTMCLTEPHAGSDVGAINTTARRNADGTFSIKGTKIFITWGEHELTENIVYPVLARIEGDPMGTKGISIFLVTKYRVNEDGSLGKRNDVHCAGTEHKMGIHGSPTCTMVFGDNDECIGELLGEERSGMKIMFKMMNEARLGVGAQGLNMGEPAFQYALEYAMERKQGSSVREFKNPDAPRVAIIEHPDVRRMLMDMKAKVEAMRMLLSYVAFNMDVEHAAEDGAEKQAAKGVVELLIPILKAWCTDVGFDVTETAIQVLGGHGFLRDHPVEQYMRDLKIGSIYEGTNGIQAMDLLGRKLGMQGGMVFMSFLSRIDELTERLAKSANVKGEAALLNELRAALAETAMGLGMSFSGGDLDLPLLNAKPFLDAMGDIVASYLLLWQAEVAEKKLAELAAAKGISDDARAGWVRGDADAAFFDTKIKTAKYFAGRYLPMSRARLEIIRNGERNALDATLAPTELAAV